MSNQSKRSEQMGSVAAPHLSRAAMTEENDDEDWGAENADRPMPAPREEVEDEPVVTAKTEPSSSPVDVSAVLEMMSHLQRDPMSLLTALDAKMADVKSRREVLDQEEKQIKHQINLVRGLAGKEPLDEERVKEAPKKKRGRRPRSESAAAPSEDSGDEAPKEGQKRFRNKEPLGDTILRCLYAMKQHAGTVADVAKAVRLAGYKTTRKNYTTVIRMGIYPLRDEKFVTPISDDDTVALTKKGVEWVENNPLS